jgi:hypothetical protein
MAFIPGPVPMVGISPSVPIKPPNPNLTNLRTQVYQGFGSAINTALNQTLQGGQSQDIVNIGVNAAVGTAVNIATGLNLFKATGLPASAITSLVPSLLSGNINNILSDTVNSAGGFANLLQNNFIGGSIGGALSNLGGFLGGTRAQTGEKWGKKEFPGAGTEGEAPANYNKNNYTLGTGGADVVFTLTRANRGPQEFGSAAASNIPDIGNTLGTNQYTSKIPSFASSAFTPAVLAKQKSMLGGNLFNANAALGSYKLPGNVIPSDIRFATNINIKTQYPK